VRPRAPASFPCTTLFRSCVSARGLTNTPGDQPSRGFRGASATGALVRDATQHDCVDYGSRSASSAASRLYVLSLKSVIGSRSTRSEEHTSELQSRENLVC